MYKLLKYTNLNMLLYLVMVTVYVCIHVFCRDCMFIRMWYALCGRGGRVHLLELVYNKDNKLYGHQ